MAIWSTITTSQIEYSRLDADFYQPRYLRELELSIKLSEKIGISKLKRLISMPVRTGRTPRSRAIKDDEPQVRFIKTDTVRSGFVNFEKSAFLPVRVLNSNDYIPDNGVVITIIGATPEIVGRAAIVRAEDPVCVTNQNVAVIATNTKCDPYFLTAYLQTDMGRDQLWRHSRRTEQVNLNCREVERILVLTPRLEVQRTIGELVRRSFAEADQSTLDYQKAHQLLETAVGLDKFTVQLSAGYTAQFSEVEVCRRTDADYFQPHYVALRRLIQKYRGGYCRLIDCASVIRPNFNPFKHADEQVAYIELADINAALGVVGHPKAYSARDLPSRARRIVETGDIIASSVIGSIDKAALIEKAHSGSLASTGFFHFRPKGISSQYLLMLIRSKCVRMQLQQASTGGILSAVPDSRLRHIIVPLLPNALQTEIEALVTHAHRAKRNSERLLEESKIRVEQLIENAAKA